MAIYLVKLTKTKTQYRITIPIELVKTAGLNNANIIKLSLTPNNTIEIEDYDVKNTKRDT